MAKKVIVLSASPRRGGNSDLLCDEFVRGARDSGHTAEKLFLRDHTINYCTGCGVCNTTHKCVQRDDMDGILEKMVAADAIVLATPVYFYSMNGQLKTLIDRTVPRYTQLAGKDFYVIMAAADTDRSMLRRTLEGLRGFYQDCVEDSTERGVVYGTGVWRPGEIKSTPAMKQAYEMGREL